MLEGNRGKLLGAVGIVGLAALGCQSPEMKFHDAVGEMGTEMVSWNWDGSGCQGVADKLREKFKKLGLVDDETGESLTHVVVEGLRDGDEGPFVRAQLRDGKTGAVVGTETVDCGSEEMF